MSLYLGIDTSNYSSSAAVFDSGTGEMRMARKLLPVPKDQIGLRQSDAVFFHVRQLSDVIRSVTGETEKIPFAAVGVSVFPRRAEGSYMPCFLVGKMAAESIGAVSGCPVYGFSHQEGHLMAALYSSGSLDLIGEPFLAFHVSGGTTEGLFVEPDGGDLMKIARVSGSLDLHAGQLIDRVGATLGCGFPAGPELEALAVKWKEPVRGTASMKGADFNLSGIQNRCEKLLLEREPAEKIARYCLESVYEALKRSAQTLLERYGRLPVVFSGGVMSNGILREKLSGIGDCRFAEPAYSADNAAGIAYYAYRKDLMK